MLIVQWILGSKYNLILWKILSILVYIFFSFRNNIFEKGRAWPFPKLTWQQCKQRVSNCWAWRRPSWLLVRRIRRIGSWPGCLLLSRVFLGLGRDFLVRAVQGRPHPVGVDHLQSVLFQELHAVLQAGQLGGDLVDGGVQVRNDVRCLSPCCFGWLKLSPLFGDFSHDEDEDE